MVSDYTVGCIGPLEGGGTSGNPAYPGGLLSGQALADVVAAAISPVEMTQQRGTVMAPVPSWGLGPAGYDVRLADFEIPDYCAFDGILDPLNVLVNLRWKFQAPIDGPGREYVVLQPGEAVRATTVETFTVPDDILILPVGKSTYTRFGLQLLATPLEPGRRGQAVVTLVNHAAKPIKYYLDGGGMQCLFFAVPGATAYDGLYQDQRTGGRRRTRSTC